MRLVVDSSESRVCGGMPRVVDVSVLEEVVVSSPLMSVVTGGLVLVTVSVVVVADDVEKLLLLVEPGTSR